MTPASQSGTLSNAEILLWQGRFRRVFVSLIGAGTIALKWAGVISADSVVARASSQNNALLLGVGLLVAYLAVLQVMLTTVERRGHASGLLVAGVVVSDMVLLFGVMLLTTPPVDYQRGLIVSIFTVQFTMLYFGQRATIYNLICVAVFYSTIVLIAANADMILRPAEHFWDLALYLLGTMLFLAMQGGMARRLQRIVHVFERAQEGDFSEQYDESADRMPDAITVVGRAYNRMRSSLEAIVLTDPLSGCFNRRGFDQIASRELSRSVRGGQSMAVLALDVDHFKAINDAYGHLTGDEVLREIGALLRETARLGDVVARMGGEEFEILAPDTDAEGAQILADRIHQAFRGRLFASLDGQRKITISIGVSADVARNDQLLAALMGRADEALYVAKRNGRDRTELWHGGMRAFDGTPAHRRSIEGKVLGAPE